MASNIALDFDNYQALSIGAITVEVYRIDGVNPPTLDTTMSLNAMDLSIEGIKISQTTDNVKKVDTMATPMYFQYPQAGIEITLPILKTSPRVEAWMKAANETSYLGNIFITTERSNLLNTTPLTSTLELKQAAIIRNHDTTIGDGATVSWSFTVSTIIPVNRLTY